MDDRVTAESASQKPPAQIDDVWTVHRIIDWTVAHLKKHGSETPRLDTEILLAHARNCERIELYTHFEDPLSDVQRATMRELVQRRAQAEPVAYLVGHREFFGLDFHVTPAVLIPRPETETLVVEVLELIKNRPEAHVLDVGTGSGCIAIAVAANNPLARLTAIDIAPEALDLARENAAAHAVAERIRFIQGDLFAPCQSGEQFDLVASNPPYVAQSEFETLSPDVRCHEPRHALVAGEDGLSVLRRLIQDAHEHLTAQGHLLIEISAEQASIVCELLEATEAYTDIAIQKDLAGRSRVVRARKRT